MRIDCPHCGGDLRKFSLLARGAAVTGARRAGCSRRLFRNPAGLHRELGPPRLPAARGHPRYAQSRDIQCRSLKSRTLGVEPAAPAECGACDQRVVDGERRQTPAPPDVRRPHRSVAPLRGHDVVCSPVLRPYARLRAVTRGRRAAGGTQLQVRTGPGSYLQARPNALVERSGHGAGRA